LKTTVLAGAQFEAIEAVVVMPTSARTAAAATTERSSGETKATRDQGVVDSVALEWWVSSQRGDGALVTSLVQLPTEYEKVRKNYHKNHFVISVQQVSSRHFFFPDCFFLQVEVRFLPFTIIHSIMH
jgi:hypothetical protein